MDNLGRSLTAEMLQFAKGNNEELEKMKLHVTDTSTVKQWELNDNEFIYISN